MAIEAHHLDASRGGFDQGMTQRGNTAERGMLDGPSRGAKRGKAERCRSMLRPQQGVCTQSDGTSDHSAEVLRILDRVHGQRHQIREIEQRHEGVQPQCRSPGGDPLVADAPTQPIEFGLWPAYHLCDALRHRVADQGIQPGRASVLHHDQADARPVFGGHQHAETPDLAQACVDRDGDAQPRAVPGPRHSLLRGTKYNPNNVYDPGLYDADDFARDMADLVGCAADAADAVPWCHDSLSYGTNQGGQGALIFTIGLGEDNMLQNPYGDPQAGEKLLRYAANVGYDGDPNPDPNPGTVPPDPCLNNSAGRSCGNYYFSPTSSELSGIFEDIASRIFTRLTQ